MLDKLFDLANPGYLDAINVARTICFSGEGEQVVKEACTAAASKAMAMRAVAEKRLLVGALVLAGAVYLYRRK